MANRAWIAILNSFPEAQREPSLLRRLLNADIKALKDLCKLCRYLKVKQSPPRGP